MYLLSLLLNYTCYIITTRRDTKVRSIPFSSIHQTFSSDLTFTLTMLPSFIAQMCSNYHNLSAFNSLSLSSS